MGTDHVRTGALRGVPIPLALLLWAAPVFAQPFTAIDDTHDQTVGGKKTHQNLKLNGVTFATLSGLSYDDGSLQYCSDCALADPCAGSGTGALAIRMAGVWNCLSASGGLGSDGTNCTSGEFAAGVDASGNAQSCDVPPTADALTNNPSDCSANQYANAIAANGNLTCGSITDADVPNSITITLAQTAGALALNGANCSAGEYPLGVDTLGAAESCTAVSGGTPWAFGTGETEDDGDATRFFHTISGGLGTSENLGQRKTVLPAARTARNLYCLLETAPGSGKSRAFTTRKNGADDALTCTISDTATSCTDAANSVTYAAGDTLGLVTVPSSNPADSFISCAMDLF